MSSQQQHAREAVVYSFHSEPYMRELGEGYASQSAKTLVSLHMVLKYSLSYIVECDGTIAK